MDGSFEVGIRSAESDYDSDFIDNELEQINSILQQKGLPLHTEPEVSYLQLDYWGDILHQMKKLAALISVKGYVLPLENIEDDILDQYFKEFGDSENAPFAHLIMHSDASGAYVPIVFDMPSLGGAGYSLGSTQALFYELQVLEAAWKEPKYLKESPEYRREYKETFSNFAQVVKYSLEYKCLILMGG